MFRVAILKRQVQLLYRAMSSQQFKYQPPVDRSMRVLNRDFFVTRVPLCAVKFPDPRSISEFSRLYKDSILRVPRIPHVVKLGFAEGHDPSRQVACDNQLVTKGVLLNDDIEKVEDVEKVLSEEAKNYLKEKNAEVIPYTYILDYNFWKAEEILRSVLPEEFLEEIPTGFTITGHVAHLNLRNEFKPFDSLIGQVILDKNNKIECVVDKVSSIATKFRTFPMKVIAGKSDNLVVEQRESDCTFRFDFSKVYWNSRLHTEHQRLVTDYFKTGEVVCDVFAGVGPFAVPAGKKNVIVLANDLNPESFKYLQENIQLNKVGECVIPFNYDGAEFIEKSATLLDELKEKNDNCIKLPVKQPRRKKRKAGEITEQQTEQKTQQFEELKIPNTISHYVMNLPDSAISFLGHFNGIFKNASPTDYDIMPYVHVHCFEKYENGEELSMEELHQRVYMRLIESLDCTKQVLPFDSVNFHLVRKVSPTKPMFCCSFRLPREVGFKH
ncbi:tRNA (guanine(37)-N1)-methyltransferase [Nakaseomyces bracarensis]|uniref:tRNA (guanine(37)-N1)-methyltransferase n=1 Tax=Nakaseomyces bracarensis TaxID=273131 RepID=A0ABR4NYF3_9SACH